MGTTLHTLAPNEGATKPKKRLGRGRGSGTGKTSGKGVKGQKARPGHHGAMRAFEGGQHPMARRFPKRGFSNAGFRSLFHEVNVQALEKHFASGATVDAKALVEKGLIRDAKLPVKVLGTGDLTKKLTVNAAKFSATAKTKIEKAGGAAVAA